MKARAVFCIVTLGLFLLACTPTNTISETEAIAIKKEVNTMFENYKRQVNDIGLKGIEFYFSKDRRFYWVEDGVIQYPDREALVAGIEEFHPAVKNVKLEVFKKDITIIDHNTVSLYVAYKEDIVLKSGYTVKLDGAMTITTIREDDTWKFLIGHSSVKKPRGGN